MNLKISDWEYTRAYQEFDTLLTEEMIQVIPKIMLRTYLYNRAKFTDRGGWKGFVGQFCNYDSLDQPSAITNLRTYLIRTLKLKYASVTTLHALTKSDDVIELANELRRIK